MENQEYKVKQIYPAHADHISHYKEKDIAKIFSESQVIVQRKYDGERMLIHFNGKETYCTSRRFSKKTGRYMENQDKILNLPCLEKLGYTVIDCEAYCDTWSESASILHSLPERAKELQLTTPLKFAAFDCLFFDGVDVREKPYSERLNYVHKLLNILNYTLNDFRFHFPDQFLVDNINAAMKLAQEYLNAGYEGVVMKPLAYKYYDVGMMLKIKRFETVDVVVYDYKQGTGKYSDTVGALLVGYYEPETDRIVHLSKVNCGTDADRDYWKQQFNNNSAIGKVLEVKCQEVTDKSLRHPVYIRIRDDKNYTMCTKDTIFKA